METNHYMNSLPDRRTGRVRGGCSLGRSGVYQLIGVSFVLLCITQSALNVYLWYRSDGISNSLNVSSSNVTLLEEVRALRLGRDQLLEKEDQHFKQIDKLLQEKNELLEKDKQLNQVRIKLHEKIKGLKQQINELVYENRELLQNETKLEREINKLQLENKLLNEEKCKLNLENNKLSHWNNQLKQEKDELVKEKNELLQNKLELEKEKNELFHENKQLNKEKCELYQEKCNLQKEKDLLEKKNKELEDKIVKKEQQILEHQEMINRVELNNPKCPLGWQRFMSSCYQLSTEANTWIYAKQDCESKGAQLMMLNDETEQRPFFGGVVKIWIGLYSQIQNNTIISYLKGVDGRLLKSGISNTLKPQFWTSFSQSCVYIDHSLPCMRTWSMGTCMEKFYWICEKQMNTNSFNSA